MLIDNLKTGMHTAIEEQGMAIVPALKALLARSRQHGIPVIYANDSFLAGDVLFGGKIKPHALRGTPGAEVIPEIAPEPGDFIVPKRRFSGFYKTDLDQTLRTLGVDTIAVAGITTPFCVLMTAQMMSVDPTTVRGTGPDGAITIEDVERAAAGPAAPAPAVDRQARMRRTIGSAMARSKREIPHYYLSTTIDMHRATQWLAAENARLPVTERLLYGVLLLKSVALAVREVPELNAVWRGDTVAPSEAAHVGVAISLRGGGLVAPALHDAGRRSLGDLMRAFRDLVQRARSGRLKSSELSDPTITVTSLGEQGVETVFGIVYPPQVAIVGFGKLVERPWSVDGRVLTRPLVTATLSADHRVSDGHRGGLFLAAVDRLLQAPERL